MTPDDARSTLTAAFIAAFSVDHPEADYFIEGISEPLLSEQQKPFAMFSVGLPRVEQSAMRDDSPPKRYYGELSIGLYLRENQGTKPFFLMQTSIENSLTIRTITSITLRGMVSAERPPAVGWQARELTIPYEFDSIP